MQQGSKVEVVGGSYAGTSGVLQYFDRGNGVWFVAVKAVVWNGKTAPAAGSMCFREDELRGA